MKKYGLRIGKIGIEFLSVEERNKALSDFTKGTDVKINDLGIRYQDGEGSFSVYDRDTKEIVTNCCVCKGAFGIDTCGERNYPNKDSWEKKYAESTGYICDACLARKIKDKKIFEAKAIVDANKDE